MGVRISGFGQKAESILTHVKVGRDQSFQWLTLAGSLGEVGETFTSTLSVKALDTRGAVTYSLVSGSLPSGITLNGTTGALAGSFPDVLTDRTYEFTIRATNTLGKTLDRTFTLTVLNLGAFYWVTPSGSLGTYYELDPVSIQLQAVSNLYLITNYAVSSGSLPAGLSLSAVDGTITGNAATLDVDTTSTFAITATNANAETITRTFTITVKDSAPFWVTPAGTVSEVSWGQDVNTSIQAAVV